MSSIEKIKLWEIWSEGYAATGERGDATLHGRFPGKTFDEAVEYANEHNKLGAERNTRNRYMSDEYWNNRRSNWNIWACNLFDNETDARKSFG